MNSTKGYLQSGFTLTEMVVAITIFVLIITAVYSAYILSQQGYREGERAAEITQNGRIILERLTREMRQAREIVTELPEGEVNPPGEIVFHDGHLSLISATGTAQGVSTTTITLAPDSSTSTDFYKNMFLKIIGGTGEGQIRKIVAYATSSKVATIEKAWDDPRPVAGSEYKIDSSYYYVRYFRDDFNNVGRQIFVYYFSDDPDSYASWDDEDEEGGSPGGPVSCILESCPGCPTTCKVLEERLIGEYVTKINFWGLEVVNVSVTLEKDNKTTEFETTVFGRNI